MYVVDPLLNFTITDADSGSNANITASISDGDDTDPKFTISGQQLYADGGKLDYEALNTKEYRYILSINANDNPQTGKSRNNMALIIVKVKLINIIITFFFLKV